MKAIVEKEKNEYEGIKESLIFLVNSDKKFLRELEKELCDLPKTRVRIFISSRDCIKQIHNKPSLILIGNYINKRDVKEIMTIVNKNYSDINVVLQ